jgi:ABC-type spermidine/putrescine transport system permease subunit I
VLLLPFGVVNGTLLELNLISRPMRLLGNDVGIILGLTQAFMPMMVLPIVAVLGRIDQSLARAATSLGASPWRVFREVTWPLSRPGVVAGTVLVFMAHLTSFVTPLLLGQGKIQTYSTVAYQQAVEVLDYPFASAFALFPFVVVFGIWGLWVIASPGVRRLRGADAGGLGV